MTAPHGASRARLLVAALLLAALGTAHAQAQAPGSLAMASGASLSVTFTQGAYANQDYWEVELNTVATPVQAAWSRTSATTRLQKCSTPCTGGCSPPCVQPQGTGYTFIIPCDQITNTALRASSFNLRMVRLERAGSCLLPVCLH